MRVLRRSSIIVQYQSLCHYIRIHFLLSFSGTIPEYIEANSGSYNELIRTDPSDMKWTLPVSEPRQRIASQYLDIDWERALLVPHKTERSKGANGVVAVSIIVYPRVLSGF